MGYYNKFVPSKSLGVCYWCVKIPQYGYLDHGLKHISFYVQKRVGAMGMCYNPALVGDKPLGALASLKRVYCRGQTKVVCILKTSFHWLNTRLQWLQCVSNRVTAVLWRKWSAFWRHHFDGLAQDCSNSNALAMEISLMKSCIKPLIFKMFEF